MELKSVPLLRKLAKKSVFTFGKYNGCYVGQIVDADKMYIGFVYYNMGGLSFTDDILEEVGITGKLAIKKPSVDAEMFEKFKKQLFHRQVQEYKDRNGDTPENDKKAYYKCRRAWRCRASKAVGSRHNEDSVRFSKSSMQAFNHGRKAFL